MVESSRLVFKLLCVKLKSLNFGFVKVTFCFQVTFCVCGFAEKRQLFRQSIDTRKLSTQAPELLACVRQNRFIYDNRVFDVASSLTGIH